MLRLLERHSLSSLKGAVEFGLEMGSVNAEAICVILETQSERPIPLFSLDGRPHLKLVQVAHTSISAYQSLQIGG